MGEYRFHSLIFWRVGLTVVFFFQDTNSADYEGVMSKKSKWMGGRQTYSTIVLKCEYIIVITLMCWFARILTEWRKRYLILKGSKLFFSKVTVVYVDFTLLTYVN